MNLKPEDSIFNVCLKYTLYSLIETNTTCLRNSKHKQNAGLFKCLSKSAVDRITIEKGVCQSNQLHHYQRVFTTEKKGSKRTKSMLDCLFLENYTYIFHSP